LEEPVVEEDLNISSLIDESEELLKSLKEIKKSLPQDF